MSKFLKVLAALFLCIGIIASFVLAFNFGYDYPYSFLKEINIPRFLGILEQRYADTCELGLYFHCTSPSLTSSTSFMIIPSGALAIALAYIKYRRAAKEA